MGRRVSAAAALTALLAACSGESPQRGADGHAGNAPAGSAGAATAGVGGSASGAPGEGAGGATGGTDSATGGAGGASGSAGECRADPPPPASSLVHEGSLVIASPEDASAAGAFVEVLGDVTVLPSYSGVLELPNLVHVGGSVNVTGDPIAFSDSWHRVTALRFPNLTTIGAELFVYLTQELVETDFRSLTSVGYRVYYMRNLGLRRVGLDSFELGNVSIQACPLVAVCEIDEICTRAGQQICGQEYSDEDCSCVTRCGRLEPHC